VLQGLRRVTPNTFSPLPAGHAAGRLPHSSMLSLLWVRR
jgi:hypothetical protein